MMVSFFEEFPTKENLAKLNLVKWPTKLYIAAKSVVEFKKIIGKIKNKNVKEIIYWPILNRKEGYWISPFTKRKALVRTLDEIKKSKIPVMIDAELPFTRKASLFLTQLPNFFSNRKLIRDFVSEYKDVYITEYPAHGKLKDLVMSFFGVHFDADRFSCRTIKMFYHSMLPFMETYVRSHLKKGRASFGKDYLVAYGTIAKGILGTEKILSYEQFDMDLKIAKQSKIEEVVIFRLGGLNKRYSELIKKYC